MNLCRSVTNYSDGRREFEIRAATWRKRSGMEISMGFCRYYIKRYENKESFFYKIIIILTAISLSFPIFARYNIKYLAGVCGKDAVFTMMMRYVFPFTEMICVILYLRLALKDTNQNIIVRYGSKKKIWILQCLGASVFSLESIILIYLGTVGFGTLLGGKYDNWFMEDSLFYNVAMKAKMPLKLPVSDIQMFILVIIIKTIILNITINIALIAGYLLNSNRLSILSAIVLCGFDWINMSGFCGILDISFMYLYNPSNCILKIIMGIIINLALYFTGLNISSYREYYNKK